MSRDRVGGQRAETLPGREGTQQAQKMVKRYDMKHQSLRTFTLVHIPNSQSN